MLRQRKGIVINDENLSILCDIDIYLKYFFVLIHYEFYFKLGAYLFKQTTYLTQISEKGERGTHTNTAIVKYSSHFQNISLYKQQCTTYFSFALL